MQEYQPYQQRVVDEKNELDDKIAKLEKFMQENAIFKTLPIIDQELQMMQHLQMVSYSYFLGQRIDRF